MMVFNFLDGFEKGCLTPKKGEANSVMRFNSNSRFDCRKAQFVAWMTHIESLGHGASNLGIGICQHVGHELDVGLADQPADRDRGIPNPRRAR